VTEVAESSVPAPTARPRPARRGVGELTYRLDPDVVEARAAREPEWLGEDRRSGLDAFERLPIEPNQLYTGYVDLRGADLADVRDHVPADASVAVPAGAGSVLEGVDAFASFAEGLVADVALSDGARRAGVSIEPLGALVARDPETARRLLLPSSLPADDRLAQLSRAAWGPGVVVRVPDGVTLDAPIVVRWAVGEPGRAVHARTIVELGRGAEAALVEELVASPGLVAGGQALFTGSTDVRLGDHARLGFASLQETGPDQVVFQQRRAELGEGAELRWALAQLGGRLVRSRVDNVLVGDRSSVEQVEIVFASGEQLHDLTSYTRHVGRDTTGQLLSKGALLDRARSFMKGLITIEKSAHGTDSYLGEFGMNLSKSARAVAIPSLEIDQPDCRRAAHSSSVGPIDEAQLFYLESRGIPPDEARKFIVLGFLEPVVARVPLEDARARLRAALEAKWAAGLAAAPRSGGAAA
jgi:Fe-S cluster assembly scaffold protein SufB